MSTLSSTRARRARHRLTCLGYLALASVVSCGQSSRAGRAGVREAVAEAAEAAPTSTSAPSAIVPHPTRLLAVSGSAYGASLASAEDGGYLLSGSAAYRFAQGEAPARWARDFGFATALTPGHILYWSSGALRQVPTSGGEATKVARVPHQPQRLVTSGDHVAWLDQAADGHFTIHTLDGPKPRLVHAAEGYVGSLAMQDERIYFAERARDNSWRLGLVPRSGGAARYSKAKRGRLPAMLVVDESLYYYDGPSSSVLRASADLGSEDVLARDVICSPIAVAENVYCAQPAGLLEIGLEGGVRRTFPLEERGSITSVAATSTQLAWVTDIGGDRLAVDSIPLSGTEPLAP